MLYRRPLPHPLRTLRGHALDRVLRSENEKASLPVPVTPSLSIAFSPGLALATCRHRASARVSKDLTRAGVSLLVTASFQNLSTRWSLRRLPATAAERVE